MRGVLALVAKVRQFVRHRIQNFGFGYRLFPPLPAIARAVLPAEGDGNAALANVAKAVRRPGEGATLGFDVFKRKPELSGQLEGETVNTPKKRFVFGMKVRHHP